MKVVLKSLCRLQVVLCEGQEPHIRLGFPASAPAALLSTLKLAFLLHVGFSTLSRLQPEPSRGPVTPQAKDGRALGAALPGPFFYTHRHPAHIPYFYLQRPPSPARISWSSTPSHVRKHSACQSRFCFSNFGSTDSSVLHTILPITAKPTSLWAQQECKLCYPQSQHPESFLRRLTTPLDNSREEAFSLLYPCR